MALNFPDAPTIGLEFGNYFWDGEKWAIIGGGGAGSGLADPGNPGLVARTAAGVTVARTIIGTAGRITLTNGNGVGGDPTINVPLQMSLTSDALGLKLSGDVASPGNNMVFGTNAAGARLWKPDPAAASGGGEFWQYLAAEFTKTNSTTLSDVPGLAVNLQAGKTYRVRGVMFVGSDGGGGGKCALNGTAAFSYFVGTANGAGANRLTGYGQSFTAGGGSGPGFGFFDVFVVVTTAGTFGMQFAQQIANGSTSRLQVGSWLSAAEYVAA